MKNRFYILFSLPLWFGISQNALCMKEEENLSRTLISLIPQEDDKGKEEDNLPISSRLQGDCNECHQKDCGSCQRDLLLEERKILLNLQNELSKGGENNEQKKEELRVNSVRWLTKWQNLIRSSKEGNLRNIVGLSKAGLEQCCNLMETCTIYPSKRSEKLSEFIQTMKSSVKNPESKIFEWHLKKEFGEGDYGQEYFESLLKMYQTSYDDLNKELTPDIHKCQNQIKLIRKHIESKENDSANLELYRFCTELISLEKKARLESIEKLKKLLEFLKNKKIFISFEILRNSNIFSAKAAAVECLSSMIASISPAFTYNESKIKKEILSFSDG